MRFSPFCTLTFYLIIVNINVFDECPTGPESWHVLSPEQSVKVAFPTAAQFIGLFSPKPFILTLVCQKENKSAERKFCQSKSCPRTTFICLTKGLLNLNTFKISLYYNSYCIISLTVFGLEVPIPIVGLSRRRKFRKLPFYISGSQLVESQHPHFFFTLSWITQHSYRYNNNGYHSYSLWWDPARDQTHNVPVSGRTQH